MAERRKTGKKAKGTIQASFFKRKKLAFSKGGVFRGRKAWRLRPNTGG
jgi:hypothetical protein